MTQEPKIRRWRWLRGFLFICVCVATLIALFYAEEDWRGAHDWKAFKNDWETKGEKLDLSNFVPPQIPEDKNFALTPLVASTYGSMIDKNGHEILPRDTNVINRLQWDLNQGDNWNEEPTNGNWAKGTLTHLEPWQTYFRTSYTNKTHVVTNDFPIAPQPQSPAQDVLLALSKYDESVEELRQASEFSESRFPLEYDKDDPAAILLPHLAAMKRCVVYLQLRAIAELQAGQSDKASADVKLMFRLIRAIHTEPFLISHLVRVVMLNFTLQPIYEGLTEHRWSDAQLQMFDSELAELNFVADYRLCIRSEAAGSAKEIDYLRRTRKLSDYLNMFNYSGERDDKWVAASSICPGGWFRQNQITFGKLYLQQCLPAADEENRTFVPKIAEQAAADLEASITHPTLDNFLENALFSPVKDWFVEGYMDARKFAYGQASADLARVAIALERDKLANGAYPESLAALTRKFTEKLPNDVIGGQPLHYRRTDGGFVLYSVGWNGQDDDGQVGRKDNGSLDPDKGDWVWSYPTK